MTADEFVEVVRKGSDKLRVDDIVLEARGQEFHGKGVLRISAERIEIEMTLDAGERPPERDIHEKRILQIAWSDRGSSSIQM